MCGKCCGGWHILADAASRAKIRGTTLELRVIQETGRPAFRRRRGEMEVAQTPAGRCVFLDGRLCSIQAELGAECKPQGCHKFPFEYARTPDGVFVGVSFFCSAAQRNEGRGLEAHHDSVLSLLEMESPIGSEPMEVHRRVTMRWPAYRALEKLVAAELAVDRALAGLSSLLASAGGRRLELTANDLTRAFSRPYDLELQTRLAEPYFALLIGYLEVDTSDGLPAFQQTVLSGGEVTFRRFEQWRGRPREAEAAGQLEPWAQAELDRYLQALLFRKFLVAERKIHGNLSLLYLLPRLFRFCAGLSRLSRGARSLEPWDVYRAFEECEYSYATHSTNLDRPVARLGQAMVDMFTR